MLKDFLEFATSLRDVVTSLCCHSDIVTQHVASFMLPWWHSDVLPCMYVQNLAGHQNSPQQTMTIGGHAVAEDIFEPAFSRPSDKSK